MDSLTFVMEIYTLQTYLGIKLIEMSLIAHSLARNMLSIEHIKHLFRAIVQAPAVLIRRNMVTYEITTLLPLQQVHTISITLV